MKQIWTVLDVKTGTGKSGKPYLQFSYTRDRDGFTEAGTVFGSPEYLKGLKKGDKVSPRYVKSPAGEWFISGYEKA